MLTCKQFLAELSDFLDEALGLEERKKLEEHINACPNCWVIADTTRKTFSPGLSAIARAAADRLRHSIVYASEAEAVAAGFAPRDAGSKVRIG